MATEKREYKLSESLLRRPHDRLPHHHVPHYHPPHHYNHDFSGLGSGVSTGTLLATKAAAATGMGSTLVTIAVVAVPVVLIGGLIWWACQDD